MERSRGVPAGEKMVGSERQPGARIETSKFAATFSKRNVGNMRLEETVIDVSIRKTTSLRSLTLAEFLLVMCTINERICNGTL